MGIVEAQSGIQGETLGFELVLEIDSGAHRKVAHLHPVGIALALGLHLDKAVIEIEVVVNELGARLDQIVKVGLGGEIRLEGGCARHRGIAGEGGREPGTEDQPISGRGRIAEGIFITVVAIDDLVEGAGIARAGRTGVIAALQVLQRDFIKCSG